MDRPSPYAANASDLGDLAVRLRGLPPSCGPVRLIAVDGHAGSGKSGFADRLAAALDGAPVLRLDDLGTDDGLLEWTDRLRDEVLTPLSDGGPASYHRYDWATRRFATRAPLPPAPVVLVEGVGAGRRAVRPHLAALLWMDLARDESWRRGRLRDGPAMVEFWERWIPAEQRHFVRDPSRPHADILVRQRGPEYTIAPGPRVAD